jgi:hypothetical protein
MILEGIVTTISATGQVNIAPMGPRVEPAMEHLLLRPFPTSRTYRNLKVHGEGVFHVIDDVFLLARAAVGTAEPLPPLVPAQHVHGFILSHACQAYEFRVLKMDESQERVAIDGEVVHVHRMRDFLGFNRAKHAVVEAAILATRRHLLPRDQIKAEYDKLAVLVEKTGGPQERDAFAFLSDYLDQPQTTEPNV